MAHCPLSIYFSSKIYIVFKSQYIYYSLVAQVVKNSPARQEAQVWSLGQEETTPGLPLQDYHSRTLAWEIPWTEEPGGLQFMESQRIRHDWVTNTHT